MDTKRGLKTGLVMVVFAVVLVCLSGAARGTEYYVSPSGNDSNSGTSPTEAWETIDKVNSEDFGAGDAIYFEGGEVFNGSLYFDVSDNGTAGNPVTVGSYGAGRATISSGYSEGFFGYDCEGFEVKDLNFVGIGRTENGNSGIYFYSDLSGASRPEHIYIDNVEVSGYKWTGINIWATGGLAGFKDVRITNAVVHDNGDKGICVGGWPPPASGWGIEDVYVGDCKVYDNPGVPGASPHTGNGILLHNIETGVIEYCEAYNNGWLDISGGGGPIGIWAFDCNNIVIQFCESGHNRTGPGTVDGGGFDFDGGAMNSVLQYNYSHDNYGAGYLICQYGGARAYANNICRYNISENDGTRNGYGAVTLYSTGSSGGVQDTLVYNNSLYAGAETTGPAIDCRSGGIYNTSIFNNIITTVAGKEVVSVGDVSGGWSFNGNCYWTYGDNIEIYWSGTRYSSLASWRTATGQETYLAGDTGFEVDPCLVNPGGGGTIGDPCALWTLNDYRLMSTSPLIGEGLDLQSLFSINPGPRDYYDANIPTGSDFDVGASEYDANVGPVARADRYYVSQYGVLNTDANSGVLSNDYVPAGTLIAMLVSSATEGSLTFDSNGAFEYDPNDTFTGRDIFTYKANDGEANSNVASVYLEVVDPHPVANDDSYSVVEDSILHVDANSGILANDVSLCGTPTAGLVSGASNGILTLYSDGSFEYEPNTGYVGTDTFTYRGTWGGYDSNVATVTIDVTSNNPVAVDDYYSTAVEVTLVVDANSGVLANDVVYKGSLSAILVSDVCNGSLWLNSDGSFMYEPNAGFTGKDVFTYKANDSYDESNVGTVSITVGALAGWWKLDDGTGSVAENSGFLGSSHDGTLTNMDNSDWVEGRIGRKSLDFDGVDDHVGIPALNLNSNTVTISAWIKRNGDQPIYAGLVFSRAGNTVAGLGFGSTGPSGDPAWNANNELAYNWNDDQAAWDFHSGLIVPDATWVFVAVVVEASQVTLYMGENGSVELRTNTITHGIEEFDGPALLGYDIHSSPRHFNGMIDDVRIYNYALSEAEIEKLANPSDSDFNGDWLVNFVDYAFFAEHWLETDYGDVNGVELTGDGKVNWEDFGLFAGWWKVTGCGGCGGADFTGDGNVDYLDLDVLAGYWLESGYGDCGGAELTGDGAVGLDDLGRFSASWLAGDKGN
jgi:hypothetical protein